LKVQTYRDRTGFDALREEWNPLVRRSATNTLFLTWEWQKAWWDAFGAGKSLYLVTLRDDGGALVGIAPIFHQESRIDPAASMPPISVERPLPVASGEPQQTVHLVGGTEVSDYLDLIAPVERNREVCAAMLDASEPRFLPPPPLRYEGLRENGFLWQLLDLRCLPSSSPTVANVAELARARGWQVQQAREDVCPVLDLPATWEEYLANTLDKKQRHELRRKMRRAEESARVDWSWITADDFETGLSTFFQLHKASHPDKDAFMDEQMQGFFRAVTRAALDQGWLRLSVLRFNGQPVASYLCFDYGGDRLVYNSGFDLSAYADLGPGIVAVGHLIQDAIQQGIKRFDFLQGNERYKYEFGAVDTEVLRLVTRR
jgi:CelD/BcsL family acetyltransferase involved in cellulose biosynthesis